MKIQIFSDLHCDVRPTKPIVIGAGVDVVACAGDVCEGAANAFVALRRIVPDRIPIIFTLGNHEFYRRFICEEIEAAKVLAPQHNVHLLENAAVTIGGVRFVGASVWTDYRIFGAHNAASAMHAARNGMNDHRLIGWRKEPWERFRPQEAAMMHAASRAYIEKTLAERDDVPVVVITHHAPHFNSVEDRFRSDILTAAFVSDLTDVIGAGRPDLWIHGHTHCSSDYRVETTRIIANPHGYGNENRSFDPTLIVEVGS